MLRLYTPNRSTWLPLLGELERAGFAVLAIVLRGHGESIQPEFMTLQKSVGDRDGKLFRSMWKDVAGAYDWLAGRPDVDLSRFALVGASIGCSVAIDYAWRDKSVDVVVCMTPGRDYLGVNSVAHIGRYGKRPMLLLASEAERDAAEYMASLAPSAKADILPQGKAAERDLHGTRMFGKVPGIEKKIATYLKTHVGPATPEIKHVIVSIQGKVYHNVTSQWVARIKPENRRVFSSAEEAAARGYRAPKKRGKKKR